MDQFHKSYQLSGLVVRASALRLGGWASIPGRVIPKTGKNGTQFLPAWRSASRVGLGCAVTMWCERIHRLCVAGRRVAGSTPEPVDLCQGLPHLSLSPFLSAYCPIKIKAKSPQNILTLLNLTYEGLVRKFHFIGI